MREDMHACRIEPEEERFAVLSCLVEELQRVREDFVVDRLHAFRTEFARIFNPLFSNLAPTRLLGGVIVVGRPTVDHVPWAYTVFHRRRVVAMTGVLHRFVTATMVSLPRRAAHSI